MRDVNGDGSLLAHHIVQPVIESLRRGKPEVILVATQERADQWETLIGRAFGYIPKNFQVEVVNPEDLANAH